MNNVAKTYVGVDISKKHLDVFSYPSNVSFRVNNSRKGVETFFQKVKTCESIEIVCEASGGYENALAQVFAENNMIVRIEDPRRIRNFAKAKGIRAKTDLIDARMIAIFAATFPREQNRRILSAKHLKLRELVQYRDQLKNMLVAEKLRLEGPVYLFSERYIKQHLSFLQKKIDELKIKIEKLVDEIDELKTKSLLMQSMPGVGRETAITLLSYLPELGTLGPKKVASLLGVAPFTKESGQYKGVAKIQDGRPKPRKALYMAALSASQHCPVFKEFYVRLVEKGKPKKKALVAVMRRMAVVLDAMIANNTKWIDKTA